MSGLDLEKFKDYEKYHNWRNGKSSFGNEEDVKNNAILFSKEMERSEIKPGSNVYEIGFGPGHFLHWARENGYDISGCEIVSEYVNKSKKNGFNVVHFDAIEALQRNKEIFDLIVMFDVLEHFSIADIHNLFAILKHRLNENGRIIARFPNGASLFSPPLQYGDLTHRSVLTASIVEQISQIYGFNVIGEYNAARNYRIRRFKSLFKIIAFLARDLMEIFIGYVYYGKRIPLDINITLILTKK